MPRASAEARSGAVWREGGRHPEPPKNLSAAAQKLWREIVEDRPVDFFRPGAAHLLEQLCVAVIAARHVAQHVEQNPLDADAERAYTNWMQRCAMHCQKLRLSIQTEVDRKSGKLDEKEGTRRGRKGKDDVLFGSNVVKF
jgi:hypothetical protein